MPDYSTAELAIGAGGTVAVSTFLFLMLQAVKDWFPQLEGRAALSVLYSLSLLVGVALVLPTQPGWTDLATYLWLVVITVSVSIVAKGVYAQLFKVSVAGVPPSSEATIPAALIDDPYERETRSITPVVMARLDDDARPMTMEERAQVAPGSRRWNAER